MTDMLYPDLSGNGAGVLDLPLSEAFINRGLEVTPEQFGAIGDGRHNDVDAINAAIDFLANTAIINRHRGGVVKFSAKRYMTYGDNINLQRGVALIGTSISTGLELTFFDPRTLGTVLYVDGANGYTILFGNQCAVEQMYVFRSDLTVPTTKAAALTEISLYAGTAFTMNGQDYTLNRLLVIGFDHVSRHFTLNKNCERPRISWVFFDCLNGIQMGLCGDLGYIGQCRAWPFLTAHRPYADDDTNARPGIAFHSAYIHDWGEWFQCNSFGWDVGFQIENSDNVSLVL
jgi:hypothetical protein